MEPSSKIMDMLHVVAQTGKRVRDENQRHELRRVDIRFFDVREDMYTTIS